MRIRGRRPWLVLVLLLVIGIASYRLYYLLWDTYHYRTALVAIARRDFRQADTHLQRCLDIDPGDLTVRLLAAQTARRRRAYGAALEHLRAYERGRGLPEALALEQRLLRVQDGNLEEIDTLLTFCRDHPDVPETPLILEAAIEGQLQANTQTYLREAAHDLDANQPETVRLRRAIDQWLGARQAPADQAQGLVWRGRAHAFVNDQAQALTDLRCALELDGDNFEARLYLALFSSANAPREAADQLRVLHARDPADKRIPFWLAVFLRNVGELADARQLLDEVLAAQPDNAMALAERGYVALELQDPADAERWLIRAIRLGPDDPQLNMALARCMRLANRPAEAKPYEDRFEQIVAQRRRKL
jgi:Tfp pilus assembly protein PilF